MPIAAGCFTGRRRAAAAVALALLTVSGALAADRPAAGAGPLRPSFVIIMTDDQGPGMMRALPATRRIIGRHGVTFSSGFASYPLCCPSRASLITGQYAHNHGTLGNSRESGGAYQALIDPERNLAAWLGAAGYDTAFAGKWLNGLRSPRIAPPGWGLWAGLVGAGGEGLSSYYDFDVFEPDGEPRHFGLAARDYQTDALTREYALPFISSHAADPDPFFLWIAYHPPHDGLGRDDPAGRRCAGGAPDERGGGHSAVPPPRYARRFEHVRVPRPPSFDEADVGDKPGFVRRRPPLSGSKLEKIERGYRCGLAALLGVDDAVQSVERALRGAGRLDDTTLVFTTDQGEMAGEHRLRGKNVPYEEAIRVPLLIRAPGVAAARSTIADPVINADLAPTILELAGTSPPPELERTIDGTSLVGPMRGETSLRDRAILIEGRKEPVRSRRGSRVRSYVGVRTRRFAYVEYHRASVGSRAEGIPLPIGAGRVTDRELYDLRRDPFELANRDRDRLYARTRGVLAELLDRLDDCSGISCQVSEPVPGPSPG